MLLLSRSIVIYFVSLSRVFFAEGSPVCLYTTVKTYTVDWNNSFSPRHFMLDKICSFDYKVKW